MKDALVTEIRGYRDSQEDDRHSFPCSFSFCAWVTEPIAESGHVAFITWPSRSDNFIGYSVWRRTVSSSNAEADTFYWSKNFYTEVIIGTIGGDLLLDRLNKMVHEGTSEIKTTKLGVNQHQAGYWIDLVNTKALLEWNSYRKALAIPQWCGSKVDTNQGVHLSRSEWYGSAI
jgi:hypothetical protein